MALVILDSPAQYNAVYSENVWMVIETTSSSRQAPRFKYIFRVKIGINTIATVKIAPDVTQNELAKFDVHRIIENFLTFDLPDLTNVVTAQVRPNSIIQYTIEFLEEWEIAGVLTQTAVLKTESRFVFNGIWLDNTHEPTEYFSPGETRFLTDAQEIRTTLNDSFYLGIINDDNLIYKYEIIAYDKDGAPLTVSEVQNNLNPVSTLEQRLVYLHAGPKNLNALPGLISGSPGQVIKPETVTYTIQCFDQPGNPTSELKNFRIRENSCKYEPVRVWFLNRLGTFEAFTFDLVSRKNSSIERNNYRKIEGKRSSTDTFEINQRQRGNIQFNTLVRANLILTSDWITEFEAQWLTDLIASPEIYLEENDDFIAMNMVTANYEERKAVNDKIFNIEIELQFSKINERQRG